MRSLLATLCSLLTFSRIAIVSATLLGYDCDNVFIPVSTLIQAAKNARSTSRTKYISPSYKKLSNRYNGPPFGPAPYTKSYLTWPVSIATTNYAQATKPSFRVVLDSKYQVFSVIVQKGQTVGECKARELVLKKTSPVNFNCIGHYITAREAKNAATKACPEIRALRSQARLSFPARYDGPPFTGSAQQLYIYPLLVYTVYKPGDDHGSRFLVMDTLCNIIGAVDKPGPSTNYVHCKESSSYGVPNNRYI